jgi:hypothetical protein
MFLPVHNSVGKSIGENWLFLLVTHPNSNLEANINRHYVLSGAWVEIEGEA